MHRKRKNAMLQFGQAGIRLTTPFQTYNGPMNERQLLEASSADRNDRDVGGR